MNSDLKQAWINILLSISDQDWEQLYQKSDYIGNTEWWNFKGYKTGEFNVIEADKRQPELYSSEKRYGLESRKVAYWASDLQTNTLEIVEPFRNNINLTFANTQGYWAGNANPTTDSTYHPINRVIKINSKILDLSEPENPFFNLIQLYGIDKTDFFNQIVSHDEKEAYPLTQRLAKLAFEKGFRGIIYKSAREYQDMNIVPGKCLVVFDLSVLDLPSHLRTKND